MDYRWKKARLSHHKLRSNCVSLVLNDCTVVCSSFGGCYSSIVLKIFFSYILTFKVCWLKLFWKSLGANTLVVWCLARLGILFSKIIVLQFPLAPFSSASLAQSSSFFVFVSLFCLDYFWFFVEGLSLFELCIPSYLFCYFFDEALYVWALFYFIISMKFYCFLFQKKSSYWQENVILLDVLLTNGGFFLWLKIYELCIYRF